MGRGRRGIINQSKTKGYHSCTRHREEDKKMVTVGLKKPKKPGFEISEDFLAELRKIDQSEVAKKLLSTSDCSSSIK